jgi:uncharacterized protein
MPERIYEGFVPGRHLIDAYGNGGFRFAEMSHRGSILALPSGISAWDARTAYGLSEHDLAAVLDERETIDLLLVGTGIDVVPLGEAPRRQLREAGIAVDVMQTGAAARTYNVLVAENRRVAAALIAVE